MLDISDELKQYFNDDGRGGYFKSDSVMKRLYIKVPILPRIYTNEDIYQESFELQESIVDGEWEFVGCIASSCKIKINLADIKLHSSNFKGQPIYVYMKVITGFDEDGNEIVFDEEIPMFTGYIDKAEKDNDKMWLMLTCYDALYYIGEQNVAKWYKKLPWDKHKGGLTLKEIRDSLFNYLNIKQVECELPNDEVKVKNQFPTIKEIKVADILKALCQINCAFGMMDRYGRFKFVYFEKGIIESAENSYPSNAYPYQCYPGQSVPIPRDSNIEDINYYRGVGNQEVVNYPFANGVTVRNDDESKGGSSVSVISINVDWDDDSEDGNITHDDDDPIYGQYIIEGNMFAYKLSEKKQAAIAFNIFNKVSPLNVVFREYESTNNALPYVEVGDRVVYTNNKGNKSAYLVTNRKTKGIQSMTDTYDAPNATDIAIAKGVTKPDSPIQQPNMISKGQAPVEKSLKSAGNSLNGKRVMVVVDWDETNKILTTKSEYIR